MGVTTEPHDRDGAAGTLPTLVVLGGPPPPEEPLRRPAGRIIGVDSGIDHALAAGLLPDVAVGDLDSVSPDGLDRIERAGVRIDRHPAAKDATDFELALEVAMEDEPSAVTIVGGHPDARIDHWLGALLGLASARWRPTRIEAWLGTALVVPVHDRAVLAVDEGATVSLLAVHGDARIASTSGLRWPLVDAVLPAGSSLGISNVATADRIELVVGRGVVVAVVPGPGGA